MTRSFRPRFQERMPEMPPEEEGGRTGLTLFGVIVMAGLVIALGAFSIFWIMSDYSGEYYVQDQKLGQVTLEVLRNPTSIGGSILIGSAINLHVVEGHVRNNNELELSFAQRGQEEADRNITASFHGIIDPARVEQGSETISFNQVLRPYTGGGNQSPDNGVSMPTMDVQEKVIKGVLTYNGASYELALKRNSLTSTFRWLKSFWPGAQ